MKHLRTIIDYTLAWTITIIYITYFTLEFLYEQLAK